MNLEPASEILAEAQDILPWVIETRRNFQRHPELALEVHPSSGSAKELLAEMRIERETGDRENPTVLASVRWRLELRCRVSVF